MIVDDDDDVRVLIRTRLRVSGLFDVVGEGADGAEAVALAEEHRPSLMLLDVSMPGMDGLEALPAASRRPARSKGAMSPGSIRRRWSSAAATGRMTTGSGSSAVCLATASSRWFDGNARRRE